MLIAFSLYPGFTSLDVIGAYQVCANWPDTDLTGGTMATSEPAIVEAVLGNLAADVPAGTRT